MAVITSEKDFDTFRGKLRGKFVLATAMRDVPPQFEAPAIATPTPSWPISRSSRRPGRGRGGRGNAAGRGVRPQADAVLDRRRRRRGARHQPRRRRHALRAERRLAQRRSDPPSPPQVVLAVEHYGRIARTLEKNIPVTLQIDIDNKFYDDDLNAFNIVGELPGTDKADEVVMLGAHFDSWHTGTGATDNAAGSAVMMEAMRLLKASGVKLRRTVRIGLWGGEEQGLLGSKEYVKAHFGDPATMQLKPEHAKFAGYFNVDNGTGAIRGVYLQGNEAVAPIFQAWMEPFKNLGMTTLDDPQHRRHRSSVVRRGRPAGLPVHPGRGRVRLAHAPLEHGRLRARPGERHDAQRGHRRVVRLQRREPRREAAAQAAAEAGGAGRAKHVAAVAALG